MFCFQMFFFLDSQQNRCFLLSSGNYLIDLKVETHSLQVSGDVLWLEWLQAIIEFWLGHRIRLLSPVVVSSAQTCFSQLNAVFKYDTYKERVAH